MLNILIHLRNHWIGINDEPENTIEKYIQDSFDFYLADSFSSTIVKGFEWWVQVFTGDDAIPFHDNHDENHRIETGEKRIPFVFYNNLLDKPS